MNRVKLWKSQGSYINADGIRMVLVLSEKYGTVLEPLYPSEYKNKKKNKK